jgi:pseudouridine-5'-phosphate glycosidase
MNNVFMSDEVRKALKLNQPILALESSILSQGMPYPQSLNFAKKAEKKCRDLGVIPATIAIINGRINIGLNQDQLKKICQKKDVKKISRRELGVAVSKKWTGSTTVSSTMQIAYKFGIKVFATGGIGGVHKNFMRSYDISQDVKALSEIPMLVITAGPKAILDIEKTMEALETSGVTMIGYKVNELPAFYSRNSNCFGIEKINKVKDIVSIFVKNIDLGLHSSILVSNPIPKQYEIPYEKINIFIEKACLEAEKKNIVGKDLTPYLLSRIVDFTNGKSLEANIQLALNNINLGIEILSEIHGN